MTDWGRVRKIYKLNTPGGSEAGKKGGVNGLGEGEEKERKELEVMILGSMALRGATN
jgi:EKC/KEOPS complex subunit CGI121/TPRKB